jgi:acyl carrier protein
MSTFEQLRTVIAETLNVPGDSIGETTTAEELTAWDSLGHVNLMIALEQTFDIQLDVEVFPTLNSVPAILDQLRAQGVE